jgi:hypothetical protein
VKTVSSVESRVGSISIKHLSRQVLTVLNIDGNSMHFFFVREIECWKASSMSGLTSFRGNNDGGW